MRKLLFWLGCMALCLCGCSSGNSGAATALNADEYAAILPYPSEEVHVRHVGLISDESVRFQMEKGLMDLSKSYWQPSQYGYRSHQFLDFDELDATDGSRGLLGTQRDDNPNGLNPAGDAPFDTGNGTVTGPILVFDIYELDFYRSNILEGIAIGLIVPDTLDLNGKDVRIEPEKMEAFLQETFDRIVSYMRQRFNDLPRSVPILCAAYQMNTSTRYARGGYIETGWYASQTPVFETIDDRWLMVPSQEMIQADPRLSAAFSTYRSQVQSYLSDMVYVSGLAHLEDGICTSLAIDINAYGKTAGEVLGLIQGARDSLSLFTDLDISYSVEIHNNGTLYALLSRLPQRTEADAVTLFN